MIWLLMATNFGVFGIFLGSGRIRCVEFSAIAY